MTTIHTLIQTCNACPSQWSGSTIRGEEVYVRFRHGHLSIDVGGERIFDYDDGTNWNGCMSYDELREITKDAAIEWPHHLTQESYDQES